MTSERSVGVVWSEETENGVTLHMRVGTGADVMLTLPNASVAAQAEAQLCSVLAMATMQFQRVAKETTSAARCGRASCQRRRMRTLRSRPRLL